MSDDRYVQVKTGLEEGDDVVLNPRALISEKEKKVKRNDDKTMPKDGKDSPGRPEKGKGGSGGGKGKFGGVPPLN
jgi:HlyD family secretion protein